LYAKGEDFVDPVFRVIFFVISFRGRSRRFNVSASPLTPDGPASGPFEMMCDRVVGDADAGRIGDPEGLLIRVQTWANDADGDAPSVQRHRVCVLLAWSAQTQGMLSRSC